MKRAIIFLFFALMFSNPNRSQATNLRGRLVRAVNGQNFPLTQTKVELLFWNGTGWNSKGYAMTGNDGFYFFVNIAPGPKFCLLIAGRYYPAVPLVVQNIAAPNYQDLPLIVN